MQFQEGSFVTGATVAINDDTIVEEDEVFLARLRHVGVETISIVEEEAQVTILDNDGKRKCLLEKDHYYLVYFL